MTCESLTADPSAEPFGAGCHVCHRWSADAVEVAYIERQSGPPVVLYACPEHAADPNPVTVPKMR